MKRFSWIVLLVIAASFYAFGHAADTRAASQANPFAGRLIRTESDPAVYYVGSDGKRHAFPNSKIYFSWYSSFASVQIVDDFELSLLPLGKNVMYRPGSRLVKISDVPEVYAVEPGGILRNIPSEEIAKTLYGPNWAKLVDDLDISFFFDYEIGGVIDVVDTRPLYPRGTAVNYQGERYIIDKSAEGTFLMRPVTPEAWLSNRFDALNTQSIVDADWREFYEVGLPVVMPESAYACLVCDRSIIIPSSKDFVTRSSSSGRYSIDLPEDWGAIFSDPELDAPSQIVWAMESIAEDGIGVAVTRRPKEGRSFEEYLHQWRTELIPEKAVIFADARDLSRFGTHEIVVSRPASGQGAEAVWVQMAEGETAFYEVVFTAPLEQFSAYREIAQRALQTFKINEAILE